MYIKNIFSNLGIIKKNNASLNNDPNLEQGKRLMKFEEQLIKRETPHLKLLQFSSIPGVSSIIEPLDDIEISVNYSQNKTHNINNLEEEFNKTLSEYTVVHKNCLIV